MSCLLFRIISLILIVNSASGQSDTLNKFNAKGKKIGYWKQYINEKSIEVDSSNSSAYRLVFFDDGELVFKYFNGRWKRRLKCSSNTQNTIIGKPELANGTYAFYDRYGRLVSEEIYKNGFPFNFIAYYYHGNKVREASMKEVIYFDKQFENMGGSYYLEVFDKGNKIIHRYWYRKGPKGWREYVVN